MAEKPKEMHRVPLLLLAAALLALGGSACASLEAGQDPAQAAPELPSPPRPQPAAPPEKPKWQGAARKAYTNAYRMCTVFSVKETARYYGVKAKPRTAAGAYALELYERPQLRRAATAGCVDAFEERR